MRVDLYNKVEQLSKRGFFPVDPGSYRLTKGFSLFPGERTDD